MEKWVAGILSGGGQSKEGTDEETGSGRLRDLPHRARTQIWLAPESSPFHCLCAPRLPARSAPQAVSRPSASRDPEKMGARPESPAPPHKKRTATGCPSWPVGAFCLPLSARQGYPQLAPGGALRRVPSVTSPSRIRLHLSQQLRNKHSLCLPPSAYFLCLVNIEK